MSLQLKRQSKIDILLLLLVGVAGFFAVGHAVAIGDWWHARFYHPSAAVQKLAEDAGMNAEGKKLFYRFSPQIVGAETLKAKCGSDKLGCTEGTSIYILQSSDPGDYDRDIVTAAHEMLHVAYSRLSAADRSAVNTETDQILRVSPSPVARSIRSQLQTYDVADRPNEAHSYIGSELSDAGTALNAYYMRYFSDRQKTTDAFLASPEGSGD